MVSDMQFAINFAKWSGQRMLDMRLGAKISLKLDHTQVTDADTAINRAFIAEVIKHSRGRDSVRGEEESHLVGGERVWVIDPIDGTYEYTDPAIAPYERTSCVGIALFVNGRLKLSVVLNPFRNELFTGDADGLVLLNGRRLPALSMPGGPGHPYDYCSWGGKPNLEELERFLGKPLGVYSAIYQVCMVAAGRSSFAAFPGHTIHDIAPGALLVMRLGGVVTDFDGNPLRWHNLKPGVLYVTPNSHGRALELIQGLGR